MKQQIIYTKEYALIVSDEKPIEGQYFLFTLYNLVFKADSTKYGENAINSCGSEYVESFTDNKLFNVEYCKTVIAHLPLKEVHILKGVPLLPEFTQEEEEDVNKIAYQEWKNKDERTGNPPHIYGIGFLEGYNKAKQTHKYTEEDLREAIRMAWEADSIHGIPGTVDLNIVLDYGKNDDLRVKWSEDEIIQSLQHPKRPKYFEFGYKPIIPHEYTTEGHLEVEVKTTTNSQGQTELVGKYIYK